MEAFRANLTLCPVCLAFVEDVRFAAPCGHTLCGACARALHEHERKRKHEKPALRCPTCRAAVNSFSPTYARPPTWAELLDAPERPSIEHHARQQVVYHRAEACRALRLVRTLGRLRAAVTGPLLARARTSLAHRVSVVIIMRRVMSELVARRVAQEVRLRQRVRQLRAVVLLRKHQLGVYAELVRDNHDEPEALLAALLAHGYVRWVPRTNRAANALVRHRENNAVVHHSHFFGQNGHVVVARELPPLDHLLPRPHHGCCGS